MSPAVETYSGWVNATLNSISSSKSVDKFQKIMWQKWKDLYRDPGFIYNDQNSGGIFSTESRKKYEIETDSGVIATYSPNLDNEERYSRNIFNQKTIMIRGAAENKSRRALSFIGYEAPLLRVKTERKGRFRISADLVAVDTNGTGDIFIVEAKLPGGDSLEKALLQSYGYAFFLACHLENAFKGDVVAHAKKCLNKFHGNGKNAGCVTGSPGVRYIIVAPSLYFYENLGRAERFERLRESLKKTTGLSEDERSELKIPNNPVFDGFAVIENEHLTFHDFGQLMHYQEVISNWFDFARDMEFSEAERLAQIRFKRLGGVSEAARADGKYIRQGVTHKVAYCLPSGDRKENLFSEIRDEAYRFFAKKNIKWHTIGESHLLSSQAYCINFFFPFSYQPEALRLLLQPIFPEIDKMLPVEDDRFVTFEWNGGKDYLGEPGYDGARGEMSTYPDAALKFTRRDGGTQIVLIEWKYTEKYQKADLAAGESGKRRQKTYLPFCEKGDCPLRLSLIDYDIKKAMVALFYEPFYQLLREQLLAREIEKDVGQGIHRVSVLHFCPAGNDAYHKTVHSKKIRDVFGNMGVIDVWKALIKNPDHFSSISPEALFQEFSLKGFSFFSDWAFYMKKRYRLA